MMVDIETSESLYSVITIPPIHPINLLTLFVFIVKDYNQFVYHNIWKH